MTENIYYSAHSVDDSALFHSPAKNHYPHDRYPLLCVHISSFFDFVRMFILANAIAHRCDRELGIWGLLKAIRLYFLIQVHSLVGYSVTLF